MLVLNAGNGWCSGYSLLLFTCRCNVHPGAAAGPACVSGWMMKSCPLKAGELPLLLDSWLRRPAPPDEHATDLSKIHTMEEHLMKNFKLKTKESVGKNLVQCGVAYCAYKTCSYPWIYCFCYCCHKLIMVNINCPLHKSPSVTK